MTRKSINLALQGGGSHGAFTWGVLDALLEDGQLHFESVSATSAGSMNAVVMAQGLLEGPQQARDLLEKFWRQVSETGSCFNPASDIRANSKKIFPWLPDFPQAQFNVFEKLSEYVSPYQFNPLNLNPLQDILNSIVDFERVKKHYPDKLFICATNVKIGEGRIFHREELTAEVVMASAALPTLFQAVLIEGDYYWDGGYTGNPALWPLFYESDSSDIMIVHVNPIYREELPREAYEIDNRINELTFNSTLIKELRSIQFVQKLLQKDMLKDEYKDRYKDIFLHAIRAEHALGKLGASSKSDTSWTFLNDLKNLGRAAAQEWIEKNFNHIGHASTVDIMNDYLAPRAAINPKTQAIKTRAAKKRKPKL